MKTLLKHLLLLCSILLTSLPSHAQESLGSPIYIAAILIDEPTADDMASMCEYYGFTEQSPSADGYRVFTHSNGTIIRFRIDGTEENPLPTIEVSSADTPKEIKEVLLQAGFSPTSKNSSTYIRGTKLANRYTTCQLPKSRNGGVVIFNKSAGSKAMTTVKHNHSSGTKRKLRKSTNP